MENDYKNVLFAVEGQADFSYLNKLIEMSKDISKIIYDSKFEEIDVVCDSFKTMNNKIFELKEELLNASKEIQKIFVYGFLDGIYSVSSNLNDIITLTKKYERVFKNDQIMQIISILGKNGALTHKELAKKLDISPQNLSMRFNRHPEWVDYIISEENYAKGSSVIYRLNGNGKLVFNKYKKTNARFFNNYKPTNKYWVRYIEEHNRVTNFKEGEYKIWEQKVLIQTK